MKLTPRHVMYSLTIFGGWVLGSWWWLTVFVPVAWLICAYRWPMAPCWGCQGKKTNKGSTRKRFGKCTRCDGSGTRWVIGSRTVNRAVRSARKYRKERGKR